MQENNNDKITIMSLDFETTGLDVDKDRIFEIGYEIYEFSTFGFPPDLKKIKSMSHLIDPQMQLSDEVMALTGYTNFDLMGRMKFSDLNYLLLEDIESVEIITGFSIVDFDIPILVNEFARSGINWKPRPSSIIDTRAIYNKYERRDMQSAVKFYLGIDKPTKHNALEDSNDSFRIFLAQYNKYCKHGAREDKDDILLADLSKISTAGLVDFAKKFTKNEKGEFLINFGKQKGESVFDNISLLEWMLDKEFTDDTKRWAMEFIESSRSEKNEEDIFE